MNEITIQQAYAADIATLQQISRETFVETYAYANTEANMRTYLEVNFGTERLSAELNDPDSFFFIAWLGKEPIGYLKLNTGKAQTEVQDDHALEIERIYVKAAHKGRGVGQQLCDKAMEIAREKGHPYVWLGVWEHNPKAIQFYTKYGFVPFGKHMFMLGDDEQVDILMRKEVEVI